MPTTDKATRTAKSRKCPAASETEPGIILPPAHDWRTTDEDEINRRRKRAREESFVIRNSNTHFPIFSNFAVASASGLTYSVEIRDVGQRRFACTCQDFRKNGLGTCKHVEAVLLHLEGRFKRLFARAIKDGSTRVDLALDDAENTLRIECGLERLPAAPRRWFDKDGRLNTLPAEEALGGLEKLRTNVLPELRV